MVLFGKDINIKDYDCSFQYGCHRCISPKINLYIQLCDLCNAKCDFCKIRKHNGFDMEKLIYSITELNKTGILKRISITGGEPLLYPERLNNVIDEIREVCNIPIVLNTNGSQIDVLKNVYDLFDNIYISKHHYKNEINDSIMQIKTPDIKALSDIDVNSKITINCVLQKNFIDTKEKIDCFMEYLSTTRIHKIKFISLYNLTEQASEKMFDIDCLIRQYLKNTNAGVLYDKDFCSCIDFIHIAENGTVIQAILKNNKTNVFDCCRQLVYNGINLYSGFSETDEVLV